MSERGGGYAPAVYRLCDKLSARKVLEVGFGDAISGMAIIESLSKRAPAFLTTIDTNAASAIREDMLSYCRALGVHWRVIHGDAMTLGLAGEYDLIHIDNVGPDESHHAAAWANLCHLVKKGGAYVVTGPLEFAGVKAALDNIGGFTYEKVSKDMSHAVKIC